MAISIKLPNDESKDKSVTLAANDELSQQCDWNCKLDAMLRLALISCYKVMTADI